MKKIIFVYRDPKYFRYFSDFVPSLLSLYKVKSITICMIACNDNQSGQEAEKVFIEQLSNPLEKSDAMFYPFDPSNVLIVTDDIRIEDMKQKYHGGVFSIRMELEEFVEKLK